MGAAVPKNPREPSPLDVVVCSFCGVEFEHTDEIDFAGWAECPECGELTPTESIRRLGHDEAATD